MGIFPKQRASSRQQKKKGNPRAVMPFLDHLRELRNRLVKALLGIAVGMIFGMIVADPVLDYVNRPYCARFEGACQFVAQSPIDPFLLKLKVALYVALIISSPIWLYQLWAFLAPGLYRREKKWAYIFVAVAAPLFFAGAVLAHFVVAKGLDFLLPKEGEGFAIDLNLSGYFDFVTGMLIVFGVAFEFPLVIYLLNLAGVVTAKQLLSWWRVAVFLVFVFTAIVTPTPDPFGMTALAIPMALLYFAAVGAAFLNDRRRARKQAALLAEEEEAEEKESHSA